MKKPAFPSSLRASSLPQAVGVLAVAVFVIAFFLIMSTAGIYCYNLPRIYLSQVKIEVRPEPLSPAPFQSRETAFQQIQSKQTLYPVIDALKLEEKWNLPKSEAYNRLAGRLELTPIRNTDLIQIDVLSPERTEAADIANQIAVQFQKQWAEQRREALEAGLSALKAEVESQRQATEAARAQMVKLREEGKIVDAEPDQPSSTFQSTSEPQPPEKMESEKRYMDAKISYLNRRKLLETAESRLSSERLQAKLQVVPPKIWEKAEPAIYPHSPSPTKLKAIMVGSAMFGGFIGIVAAVIAVFSLRRKS